MIVNIAKWALAHRDRYRIEDDAMFICEAVRLGWMTDPFRHLTPYVM